ncbi:lysoplasmalogenase family protein [Thioclava sp. FR2]|uniref:lysoplasmalogenase family protein n=1 Tax=Thioclava sp. FR2 TaxID=3445780 RepID=UPI003EBDA431
MFDLIFRVAASLGAIAGLIYWFAYSWRDGDDWLRSMVKTVTLAPIALFWLATSLMAGDAVWIMAAGLLLGVLGDYFLSRPGTGAFLAGMGAFGLGHLVYAVALFTRSADLGFAPFTGEHCWALLSLAALVLSTEFWLAPRTGALRWPVRAYVALIALMAIAAILLPPNAGTSDLQLGALLFLASDLLLALRLFVVTTDRLKALLGAALWPAYVLGQLLIFWGSILFWTFPKG